MYEITAFAKINLCLTITGRRPDGYHLLDSVMLPISITDTLQVDPAPDLRVSVSGLAAPTGEANLVYQAARAFSRELGFANKGVAIHIDKHIPVAAGLGGGSADAAAALRALNALWCANWPLARLAEWAQQLGADMPYCIHSVPSRVTGIGERVAPLNRPQPALHLVLVTPRATWHGAKTARVYRAFAAGGRFSQGPGDVDAVLGALAAGDLDALAAHMKNDLEEPTIGLQPQVGQVKRRLLAAGAVTAVMSGAGPTVMGLARDAHHAREILLQVRNEDGWAAAVATVS